MAAPERRGRRVGVIGVPQEQEALPEGQALSFEERLGLLVDRELTERANRRLATRLRFARLRQEACLEDIDFRAPAASTSLCC